VITSALTFLFNGLPVNLFPEPYQPFLLVLQRLIPYLGSIGSYVISWDWDWITNENTGE
jgi:hypothetical protein